MGAEISDTLHALLRLSNALLLYSQWLDRTHAVTGLELSCLRWIAAGQPVSIAELSRRAGLSPVAAMDLLDLLVGRDLVAVALLFDAKRRLQVRLTLTTKGLELVEAAPPPVAEQLAEVLEGLGPEERSRLADAIDLLSVLVVSRQDPPPDAPWPVTRGQG